MCGAVAVLASNLASNTRSLFVKQGRKFYALPAHADRKPEPWSIASLQSLRSVKIVLIFFACGLVLVGFEQYAIGISVTQ